MEGGYQEKRLIVRSEPLFFWKD